MTCRSNLVWNVYVSDFNRKKIITHNVFNHASVMEDLRKAARTCRDDERDRFEAKVKSTMTYYYWSKCEWEIIITDWPTSGKVEEKVDVYDQLRLNWDKFMDYLWENRAVLRRREKVKADRKALDG